MRDKSVMFILLEHYADKLRACVVRKGIGVSAGEYADYCGISRTQAKIRLQQLIKADRAQATKLAHNNKTMATYYSPLCQHEWVSDAWSLENPEGAMCRKCGVRDG